MLGIIKSVFRAILTVSLAVLGLATPAGAQLPRPMGFRPQMPGAPAMAAATNASTMANASRTMFIPPQFGSGFHFPMLMGMGYEAAYPRTAGSAPAMPAYAAYGMGGSTYQPNQNDYTQMRSQSSSSSESRSTIQVEWLSRSLKASGVPNDKGRIRWPIGLQILAGNRTDELREQLQALFQIAAAEAESGPVNANVSNQLSKDLEEFRQRLLADKNERFGMPLRVYEEAERFLAKLSAAEKVLRAGLGSPAAAVELKTGTTTTPPAPAKPNTPK
jgi:hypothetical protein